MSSSSLTASDHNTANRERAVLCSLFHHFDNLSFRRELLTSLRQYRFTLREHQCIFDALCNIPHRPGAPLRQQLLQRLTTMGFPDVDLAFLREVPQFSQSQSREALQSLLSDSPHFH